MKNISIWKDERKVKDYPKLNEDKNIDVLIIGGGITGVSTLYNLRKSKLNVMLVEQNKIGQSITGSSTGKLTYLQNDLIDKIRKSFSDKEALEYLASQKDAINIVKDIVDKEKINCNLEKVDSYLYTNNEKEINKLKELKKFLNRNGFDIKEESVDLISNKYMIKAQNTYMFHPIKYVYGLLNNNSYPIYENTSITKIDKKEDYYLCYTNNYKIKTKWVVLASHYPYFTIPFLFPIKGSLEKSYLSASKMNIKPLSLISYSNPFISIRTFKENLIYLSNSHSVNTDVDDEKNFSELKKKLKDLKLTPDYLWSNIDIITNDGLPYIGKIKDKLLLGTGYNTWGLTNGTLAGKILSDIILNNDNKYIKLFSPTRVNLSKVGKIFDDAIKSAEGYLNGYINKSDSINYTKINDKDVMIYKDNKKEHIVCRKCPHLGCNLLFNETEKTWDCPCHGSRFNIDGKCISAPANKDITVKKTNYKGK